MVSIKLEEYSKSKVDWAGNMLISETSSHKDKEKALEILDKSALVVQRLKRLPSILKKLKRRYEGKEPTMNLSQMQDIAGCRAVLSNVESVKKVYLESYTFFTDSTFDKTALHPAMSC